MSTTHKALSPDLLPVAINVGPGASAFAPDLTIISAGFDAARGDPLGMCDVTPTGYAQMTQLLNTVSGGKLLVILEGGYNLRSISSSATAVIKVLLGESPECDLDDHLPSRAGMKTVLDVLAIQKNFWPVLESSFSKLQSLLEIFATERRLDGLFREIIQGALKLAWTLGI
ncbi:histone deacetylase 15 isoform X5 [Cucumis melo var. makuwa]|uniref:histone deacetylase n=1 Tax=Cucumis melo var. makuwa TaxID=1194695 RepID=A0A5D3DY58_CUCMM|nr:histone deacetylase 15 isoform X5 [Cucumis melo var. makuwa]